MHISSWEMARKGAVDEAFEQRYISVMRSANPMLLE